MDAQFTLLVSFPPDTAARLALDTGKGRREAFSPLSEALLDAGAKSVYWGEPEKNVHTPESVHGEQSQEIKRGHRAPLFASQQAPTPGEDKAERVVIDCLSTAGRALEKKVLMELMTKRGVGLNAARKAIVRLGLRLRARQFAVPREGKKSAVYVALI